MNTQINTLIGQTLKNVMSMNEREVYKMRHFLYRIYTEEEEDGVLSKVPMQGFFRIWTRELSLDAVFMTVFAIGRTDMMLYD